MLLLKTLLAVPLVVGLTATPGLAAPPAPADSRCLAPTTFISQLSSAGDWVVERSPHHAPDPQVKGVIFRHSGMIDVALFQRGCLAAIVVVGEAKPDLMV